MTIEEEAVDLLFKGKPPAPEYFIDVCDKYSDEEWPDDYYELCDGYKHFYCLELYHEYLSFSEEGLS